MGDGPAGEENWQRKVSTIVGEISVTSMLETQSSRVLPLPLMSGSADIGKEPVLLENSCINFH